MKKKLFLALLTTLLLLLAASTALAADYSDYTCTSCGNPCEAWYPLSGNGLNYHVPACYSCDIALLDKKEHCTPKDGTATCKSAPRCNVCSIPMSVEYGPDPDAHSMVESWSFSNETQHFRVCQNGCSKTEYADHTGGTATCSAKAVCTDCRNEYGGLSDSNHGKFSDWEPYTATQHYRYCIECSENCEYADHTGGTATCMELAECEVCHKPYGDLSDTNHGAFTEWTPISDAQHYRHCMDCGMNEEYEAHSGGTATCTQRAVCDVCHTQYGEFSDTNHGEFSDWMSVNNIQHLRYCTSCAMNKEYADHTGGTATCTEYAVCEVCHAPYGELSDTNHGEFTDWLWFDDAQHYRRCQDCGWNREYANHTGGTATCTERAVCKVCNAQYGELSDTNHGKFSDWIPYDDTQHYRRCIDCWENRVYADHTGGTATCASGPICEVCGGEYGEKLSTHNGPFGEWERVTVNQHWRMCATCEEYEREDHIGGTATCAAYPVCDVCHEEYGSRSSTHTGKLSYEYLSVDHHYTTCDVCNQTFADPHTGGTATCESDPICELCETAYGESLGSHDWGNWESNGDGTHTRVCANDATHTETEDCSGGKATCTAKAVCEVCSGKHGAVLGHIPGAEADCTNDQLCTREGCGAVLAKKLGHDYAAVVIKPTCTEQGYTTYTCSRCKDSYKADQTAAREHWYDQWYSNQDGTHSAACKRYGCSHEGTAECTLYEVTVKDGDTETILTVCPVCGDHERGIFGVVSGATIKTVYINQRLPRGEQIVRELDAPFDGVLYAFTAAYESAGYVEPFNGKVSVSLPLEAEKYAEFKLVRVDVTPATETTERTEVWTEVAFNFENGRLTFETYVDGLFLLVPVE